MSARAGINVLQNDLYSACAPSIPFSREVFFDRERSLSDQGLVDYVSQLIQQRYSWKLDGNKMPRSFSMALIRGQEPIAAVSLHTQQSRIMVSSARLLAAEMVHLGLDVNPSQEEIIVVSVADGLLSSLGSSSFAAIDRNIRFLHADQSGRIKEELLKPEQSAVNVAAKYHAFRNRAEDGSESLTSTNDDFMTQSIRFQRHYAPLLEKLALKKGGFQQEEYQEIRDRLSLSQNIPFLDELFAQVNRRKVQALDDSLIKLAMLVAVANSTVASAKRSGANFGAAIVAQSGKVFGGSTVEFPMDPEASVCAERAALGRMVLEEPHCVPPNGNQAKLVVLFSPFLEPTRPCDICATPLRAYAKEANVIYFTPNALKSYQDMEEILATSYHDTPNGRRKPPSQFLLSQCYQFFRRWIGSFFVS